jgi:hypothetical protein
MSEEMAGGMKSFMNGYTKGIKDTRDFIKREADAELFSVHKFVTEIVSKLDKLIKEKELNERKNLSQP